MDKTSLHDLIYGHFGQATYNTEYGEWIFDRRPGNRRELRQLGSWKTALPSPLTTDSPPTGYSHSSNAPRDAQQSAKQLGRDIPDLVPSLDLLPELALVSAAVTSASHTYDPTVGALLSFGPCAVERRPLYVAALPTGEAGNVLRLTLLTKQRYYWGVHDNIWLERPSIGGESGHWVGDATPIQQICFAQTEERSAFLAVRFPNRTVLFRPTVCPRRKTPTHSRLYHLPSSRVDPHPIYSIPLDKTGGAPHVDVTFNPDYQRQLGIVGQKGNWSVWDIEGGYKGDSYYLTCSAAGMISSGSDKEKKPVREDGWARILWIGDVNTILVCNRKRLEVFSIRGGGTTALGGYQPIFQHTDDWILDVKRHATNTHLFFVLTSKRLVLMSVTCQNDVLGNTGVEAGASVVLSWTHFRGSDDITLQLSVPALPDDVPSRVLLSSRLNNLVTMFQFQSHELDPSRIFSSSDPMTLDMGDLFESDQPQRHITSLHLEQLFWTEDVRHPSTGFAVKYRDDGVQFYRLSVMLSDLSIEQAVYYELNPEADAGTELTLDPSFNSLNIPLRLGPRSSMLVNEVNDFVVPDGFDVGSGPALRRKTHSTKISKYLRDSDEADGNGKSDVVTHVSLYDALAGGAGEREGEESNVDSEEVTDIMQRVSSIMEEDTDQDLVPHGTMFDLAKTRVNVSDIDEASSRMQALLVQDTDELSQAKAWGLKPIASEEALALAGAEGVQCSISSLYDTILENWIAPLPTATLNRLRQTKERLARRIAAEVMLASCRVRHPDPPALPLAPTTLQLRSSQDSGIALHSATLFSSQPTSSQSQLPSSQFQSQSLSHPQLQGAPSSAVPTPHPNPLDRLRAHLTITKPAATVTPNVSQILMHWNPSATPESYDWAATTEAVDATLGISQPDEDDETAQREKRRAQRKAERLLKRQKRESEVALRQKTGMQPLGGDSWASRSSPPLMVGGFGMSSPIKGRTHPANGMGMGMGVANQTPGRGEGQSHSQSQSQDPFTPWKNVQSQVEPGRFGGVRAFAGTPATGKKKKKKGRVSGF